MVSDRIECRRVVFRKGRMGILAVKALLVPIDPKIVSIFSANLYIY